MLRSRAETPAHCKRGSADQYTRSVRAIAAYGEARVALGYQQGSNCAEDVKQVGGVVVHAPLYDLSTVIVGATHGRYEKGRYDDRRTQHRQVVLQACALCNASKLCAWHISRFQIGGPTVPSVGLEATPVVRLSLLAKEQWPRGPLTCRLDHEPRWS